MTASASLTVFMVKIPLHSLIPLTVIVTILPFSTKVFITVLYVNARLPFPYGSNAIRKSSALTVFSSPLIQSKRQSFNLSVFVLTDSFSVGSPA